MKRNSHRWINIKICAVSIMLVSACVAQAAAYEQSPFIISLIPAQHDISRRGGIIVCDLNNDGRRDYLVSTKTADYGPGTATIATYDHDGTLIWAQENISLQINGNAENYGLPGWFGPGIGAADIDNNGTVEVVHLSDENEIVIRSGANGEVTERVYVRPSISLWVRIRKSWDVFVREFLPSFGTRGKRKIFEYLFGIPSNWGHFQLLDLDGDGVDDEIVLQGDPYPFRWLVAVDLKTRRRIWQRCDYVGCRHNGFRAADIDSDRRDEIVGGTAIDHDGTDLVT